ncbi:ornithine cyclodeaminase [compost metagenome]
MALAEGAIAADAIAGELGQVVAGELAGRRDRQEITLFNSVGIGALDLAIGRLAYDRAVEQRLGQDVDLSS